MSESSRKKAALERQRRALERKEQQQKTSLEKEHEREQRRSEEAAALVRAPSQSEPHGFRAWHIAVGAPISCVAIGMSLAMASSNYFWIGVGLAYIGVIWLLLDWWLFSKELSFGWRLAGTGVTLLIGGILTFVALRPAPLEIDMESMEGNYPAGSIVSGIEWKAAYSEIRIALHNGSLGQYQNVDAFIRTDATIVKIGSMNHFTDCKGMAYLAGIQVRMPTLTMKGDNGKPDTDMPLGDWTADEFRIYCDKILPMDTVEIVVAVANGFRNGKKIGPSWASAKIDYDAYFRPNEVPASKCFLKSCINVPVPEF